MTEEGKQKKFEYILKYQRKNYVSVTLKYRLKEDKDVLDYLDSLPNRSEYIKKLIADDMKRH